MKKTLVGVTAAVLAGAAGAGHAADLYAPASLKDGAAFVPDPVWTGFYFGANIGAAWSSVELGQNVFNNNISVCETPAPATGAGGTGGGGTGSGGGTGGGGSSGGGTGDGATAVAATAAVMTAAVAAAVAAVVVAAAVAGPRLPRYAAQLVLGASAVPV